jgi:hypothetical protein
VDARQKLSAAHYFEKPKMLEKKADNAQELMKPVLSLPIVD